MKILYILLKDLRLRVRDHMALLTNLAMPIVLIGILGVSLGPMFSNVSPGVNRFAVAVVDEDRGMMARQLVDNVLGRDMAHLVELREMSESDAIDAASDDVAAAIIIPVGFTRAIEQGKTTALRLVANPQSTINSNIIYQVVQNYSIGISSVTTGINTILKVISSVGVPADIDKIVNTSTERLSSVQEKAFTAVSFNQQSADSDNITAMQYYAAAMLAMFSMFMAMTGVSSILEERENHTLYRLYSTGVSKWQIMSGKLISSWINAFIDALIVMFFTCYVFGVNWGNGVAAVSVAAATVFAATGFAMIIAAIARTSRAAGGLSSVLIQVMSALGGSMFPLYMFSGIMRTVSKGTINYWSLQGFLNLMGGQTVSAVTTPLVVLIFIGSLGLCTGILALRID